MTITNEKGEIEKGDLSYNRQDFREITSNKQLNFLQHIKTLLKITGEAAADLAEFVKLYNPQNRHKRKETWSEENEEDR